MRPRNRLDDAAVVAVRLRIANVAACVACGARLIASCSRPGSPLLASLDRIGRSTVGGMADTESGSRPAITILVSNLASKRLICKMGGQESSVWSREPHRGRTRSARASPHAATAYNAPSAQDDAGRGCRCPRSGCSASRTAHTCRCQREGPTDRCSSSLIRSLLDRSCGDRITDCSAWCTVDRSRNVTSGAMDGFLQARGGGSLHYGVRAV
jgi:hypothetical protein